jgi:hypothetical protein
MQHGSGKESLVGSLQQMAWPSVGKGNFLAVRLSVRTISYEIPDLKVSLHFRQSRVENRREHPADFIAKRPQPARAMENKVQHSPHRIPAHWKSKTQLRPLNSIYQHYKFWYAAQLAHDF